VVDLNRFRYDPTFTPEVSDGLLVEANQLADQAEIDRRTDLYFAPYHMAVSNLLDAIGQRQDSVNVILVHSMTNSFGGTLRPQHAEVMCDNDTRLAKPLLEAWRKQEGFVIGDNEPYRLDETDYTAITHCARRGLPHVQIEVRQDLIGTKENAEQWAERLAVAMEEAGIT
jgi:predicted N-formylglutamate amidohydrolase